jgi:hypothetical protein
MGANETEAGGSQMGMTGMTGGAMGSMLSDDMDKPVKLPTVQKPFNLTKLKPKVLPKPEAIKKEIKANPIPKGMLTRSLAEIEQEKKDRRSKITEDVKQDYVNDPKKRF